MGEAVAEVLVLDNDWGISGSNNEFESNNLFAIPKNAFKLLLLL